jgi:hypothetical protein
MRRIQLVSLILIVGGFAAIAAFPLSVSWKPPIIPVEISMDSRGHIDVVAINSWATPIGEFSFGWRIPLWSRESILILLVDGREYQYRVGGSELSIRVRGLLLENLIKDPEGNLIVIASRVVPGIAPKSVPFYEMIKAVKAGPEYGILGHWLTGRPITEMRMFDWAYHDQDYFLNMATWGEFGVHMLPGAKYAYSGNLLTIYWKNGHERGLVSWLDNNSFTYRILVHPDRSQVGKELLFERYIDKDSTRYDHSSRSWTAVIDPAKRY